MRGASDAFAKARGRRTALANYALALLTVGFALAVALVISKWDIRVLMFPFYAAVVGSAWLGLGPGCVAIVLSTVAAQYFFTPPGWDFVIHPDDGPFIATFAICALTSFVWASQRRRAERALQAARDSLEETVQERTAALVETNEALKLEMAERQAAQLELRETEAKLARSLRLATVAELAAAIAHEINQPIAAMVANAGACNRLLLREPPALNEAREAAGCIVSDGLRAGNVVTGIRGLLAKEPPAQQLLDLNQLLRETLMLCHGTLKRHAILVMTELAEPLGLVMGDPIQIQQVFLNLTTNAVEAMAEVLDRPCRLMIRSGQDDNGTVVITFDDDGPGFDPAQVDRVFDSFYTTKPTGIGVGLSISRSIIEAHGGCLSASAGPARGARLTVTLPLALGG